MLQTIDLRTEYLVNPIGLDAVVPRLSWKIRSDGRNVLQSAYQVQASENENFNTLTWDSGRVQASQSQGVLYNGPTLKSMARIYWRVKVWRNLRDESLFSDPVSFEMGLLHVSDWKARWIEPEKDVNIDAYKPVPYIRKEFTVKKGLARASAFMTAKGLYSFFLNGIEGTEDLFTPGFTSYHKRLQYQVYDITKLLQEGSNALGVMLGDGWWRGSSGALNLKNNFGYKVAFLGQLVLEYHDGTREIVGSDDSFKTTYGPLLKSDMKAGEIFDARKQIDGWNQIGYNDSSWKPVQVAGDGLDNLIATRSVPVRQKERFTPNVLRTPNGEYVLDFGQNLAGWVEMKVQGDQGTEVVLIHGEALDKHGDFTLNNLAVHGVLEDFQEVHYILSGNGVESYRPRFSIFGFRYALVKNYPGEVKPENFTAIAIYSDLEETGDFTCSNPQINQLLSNSRWSQKSNFMEIPTDCPTRERAGWTGDAQLYCKTASDLTNVYPFFEKWMADVASEQFPDGAVPNTVPIVLGNHNMEEWERFIKQKGNENLGIVVPQPGTAGMMEASAGWGDASVIIPWTMYLCYGDKGILEKQFESAKAWVDYMASSARLANEHYKDTPAYQNYTDGELDANYIWDTKFHWGEWLEADMSISDVGGQWVADRMTYSDPLVATAYYAYSTRLLADMASVLGKAEVEKKYEALYEKIKRVYNKYFIKEDGYMLDDRQAPNVRTLAFDLAYGGKRQAVSDRLAQMVIENEYHLNTGFLSTPFILQVLADHGYGDIAFRLLEQETFPSWLYAVTKGATTIWESWRGVTPEGELSGSLNHYSYGAVCDFLFSGVAGIRPVWENPGYKHFILKPMHGGTLTQASATYESPYGTIASRWEKTDSGITYRFTVPANTTATIQLPMNMEDTKRLSNDFEVDARCEDGRIVFTVGSGEYILTL